MYQMDIFRNSAGNVNCYLLKNGNGFFMVDTGLSHHRASTERLLTGCGCGPGDLKLILLTHGDTDHTGNAAYLRRKYGAKIGLHPEEQKVAATGNMLHNRKPWPVLAQVLAPPVMYLFGGTGKNRYVPDIWLEDGMELNDYGLDARVIHLPGHTRGSVGILTAEGDLFCGDLLVSRNRIPRKNHLIDDEAVMNASIEKLKTLRIRTVYPGHGRSFSMDKLVLL